MQTFVQLSANYKQTIKFYFSDNKMCFSFLRTKKFNSYYSARQTTTRTKPTNKQLNETIIINNNFEISAETVSLDQNETPFDTVQATMETSHKNPSDDPGLIDRH